MRSSASQDGRHLTRAQRVLGRVRRRRWLALGFVVGAALITLQSGPVPPTDASIASPGTGRLIWVNGGSDTPQTASWDGAAWSSAGATVATIGEWRILQAAESADRDEAIVVGVDASGTIAVMQWDGSAWSDAGFSPIGPVSESFWWGFDVAYESQSGDAVAVWNTGSTTDLTTATWDGATWSAPTSVALPTTGEPQHLRLESNPNADELVLVVSNSSSDDYALVWDGSTWGDSLVLSTGTGDDLTDVAVAYEHASGDAMVAWGDGSTALHWLTWDGTSWSTASSVSAPAGMGGNVRWVDMSADPSSDRIAAGVLSFSDESWVAIWDGAAWQDVTTVTTGAPGSIFPAVAVAFEGSSGDALVVYGESASQVRFRTWSAGGPWSVEQVGPDLGQTPNSLILTPSPTRNEVMLTAQDDGSDLVVAQWDGSGWGAVTQITADTGEVKNQPFVFIWDLEQNEPPTFDQDLGDRSDSEGVVVSVPSPATDPEGLALTYAAMGFPPGVTIDAATGLVSGTVANSAAVGSPYPVTVTVTDSHGLASTDEFVWSIDPRPSLVGSMRDDSTGMSVSGLASATDGAVFAFGDPGFAIEPVGTTGTGNLVAEFESFGSAADVASVHMVERTVVVGVSPAMTLERGDVLISMDQNVTLVGTTTLAVTNRDLVLFRPDTPGDYTAGTFTMVLDDPVGTELRGASLVEADTDVGDVTVPAGSLLLIAAGGSQDGSILLFTPTGVGRERRPAPPPSCSTNPRRTSTHRFGVWTFWRDRGRGSAQGRSCSS